MAVDAIQELYTLVSQRARSKGVAARLCDFWTAGSYIGQAKVVKDRVQKALEALMLKSARNPKPEPQNSNSESRIPKPATRNP